MERLMNIFYKKYACIQFILIVLIITIHSNFTFSSTKNLKISIPKPVFVLPPFTGKYSDREATIAPHEEDLAKELRTILDTDDRRLAVEKLNTFFELELSPAMLHLKGQVYFNLEEYEESERVFKLAIARMPEFVRAHSDLAKVYIVKENYPLARDHLARTISLGEHNAENYGQLGFINMELFNAHSAVAMYQNALALDPSNVQWQQGLLAALTESGLEKSALSLLDEMLKQQPESIDLWLSRAFIYSKLENNLKALSSLEIAIALGNNDPSNYLSSAQLHLQLNSHERAITLFSKYIDTADFEISMLYQAIQWLGQNNQWQFAEALISKFENSKFNKNKTKNSQYLLQKAYIKAGLNQSSEAEKLFIRALDTDPTNTDALISAAKFYYVQKNYIESEILYSRAEAFEDSRKTAILGRAQIQIDLKNYEAALNLLRIAYRNYPELVDLKENISILENTIRVQKL